MYMAMAHGAFLNRPVGNGGAASPVQGTPAPHTLEEDLEKKHGLSPDLFAFEDEEPA